MDGPDLPRGESLEELGQRLKRVAENATIVQAGIKEEFRYPKGLRKAHETPRRLAEAF